LPKLQLERYTTSESTSLTAPQHRWATDNNPVSSNTPKSRCALLERHVQHAQSTAWRFKP